MIAPHHFPGISSCLTMDLDSLAANYRSLSQRVLSASCAPTVKADAYGLGVDSVLPTLLQSGADCFFVAHPCEAEHVRTLAPGVHIYVLNGLGQGVGEFYADSGIRPVLSSIEAIRAWNHLCKERGKAFPAAVHVDTGMNRLGVSCSDLQTLHANHEIPGAFDFCLLLTHFVNSKEPSDPSNVEQIEKFAVIRSLFPEVPTSISDSSGIFLPYTYGEHIARPGYALYGGNPTPGKPNPMRTVVSLHSPILQVRKVLPGETVGYQGTWTSPDERDIAIVSCGYSDGYPGCAAWVEEKPRGMVSILDTRCPIVGKISMDVMAVDVTEVPNQANRLHPGCMAEIFGESIALEEVANWGRTSGYDILCRLSQTRRRCQTILKSMTSTS